MAAGVFTTGHFELKYFEINKIFSAKGKGLMNIQNALRAIPFKNVEGGQERKPIQNVIWGGGGLMIIKNAQ